jgi:hypothetical protein
LARRCSFAYEVANAGYRWDAARKLGSFTFSAGGQQCNRQETQHGPLIIENVAEELDAPSEFFFNTTTKVLTFWYNATAGTPRQLTSPLWPLRSRRSSPHAAPRRRLSRR